MAIWWAVTVRDLCLHRSEILGSLPTPQSCSSSQQHLRRDGKVFLFSFQGYYRAGYSLLQLLQHYEAARMFFEGLQLLQGSSDQSQFADFLVGVFTTMGSKFDLGEAFPPFFLPSFSPPSFPSFLPSSPSYFI